MSSIVVVVVDALAAGATGVAVVDAAASWYTTIVASAFLHGLNPHNPLLCSHLFQLLKFFIT